MTTFKMHNFATGAQIEKTQKNKPKIKGFVCVAKQRVLPEKNSKGERLFYDANNRPYYARVNAEGSHYQP